MANERDDGLREGADGEADNVPATEPEVEEED